MDYLNSILERKRADLKKLLPLEGKLRASAIQRNDYAGFRTAVDLGETRLSVIPEISRVHPALRLREAAQDIRHMYGMFLQGGAQGISIAVEPEVYGGSGTWFPLFPESVPFPSWRATCSFIPP